MGPHKERAVCRMMVSINMMVGATAAAAAVSAPGRDNLRFYRPSAMYVP